MAQDLGPGRSACILAVVVGCFAILWPSIFYPMLKGSIFPSSDDRNEYNRQEQSHYLRPNAMHPALREHGRAVLQPHSVPQPLRERRSVPPPVIAAKKPPIPGLRPPMAGGGHAPSQKDNAGPMGILMPLYTVGIVIFFVYTITKLVCKKHDNNTPYIHDPRLHRLVYQNKAKESKHSTDVKRSGTTSQDTIKLVMSAISSLLQEVNQDILKREMNKEQQEIRTTEDSTLDKNTSAKAVRNELEAQSNETCVEKQVNTENDHLKHSCQEVNDPTPVQVRETEISEICTNGQSWNHSSEELANESSTPLLTNESVNSNLLSTRNVVEELVEELSEILESKATLSTTTKDSNQEVDRNETEENKMHMDDKGGENTSASNESTTSKQDSFEKDVSTTEL